MTAETSGESMYVILELIREGVRVSDWTVVSLWSWTYSLSTCSNSNNRSAIMFFPTPCGPINNIGSVAVS